MFTAERRRSIALAEYPEIEVIVIGGKLYKYEMVTVLAVTIEAFRNIRADLYFLGINSLHPEVGISTLDLEEVFSFKLDHDRRAARPWDACESR